MYRIESLLSARLFLQPLINEDRIYFISNLSGHLSLYAMNFGGSVPEPLLPPHIALQNPHLLDGKSFFVFPKLNKILVMIDKDGDENYQPMVIPIHGGYPEPAFGDAFENYRVHCGPCDPDHNLVYLTAESIQEQLVSSYQANLENGDIIKLGESKWGSFVDGVDRSNDKAILIDAYTAGDHAIYFWTRESPVRELLFGVPLEDRLPDQEVPLNSIFSSHFTQSSRAILFITSLFDDTYGLGTIDLEGKREPEPVKVLGLKHKGRGELVDLKRVVENKYLLIYNIDGCSWVYEAQFDESSSTVNSNYVLVGGGPLSNGVLESITYDKEGDRFALSFSTATSPTQIVTIAGEDREKIVYHTNDKILGIPEGVLSPGEDASFRSFDGLDISARLYLPSSQLNFSGPRPVVYYVHGGPQSQERPDFAWFSMPLIQFLTLNGFAVFVPNVRGSSGYGLNYMKKVDHDWGGQDRLDHVHALSEHLSRDNRLDTARAAVVGRSYGGFMTLTLASRHSELWSAAVDMFGPYDLLTFMERLPETWKPYFIISIGDPDEDRDFLTERSPRTYIDKINCPLMVIQGKNDPRVIERESLDVVEHLRSIGKEVEYLMFENEGHDVLKFENRVTTYNAIAEFFKTHLQP